MGTTWELDDTVTTVSIDDTTLSISPSLTITPSSTTVSNITFSPTADDDVIDLDLFTNINSESLDVSSATINGTSLVDTLAEMQHRLGIIEQNPQLEKEWKQLRDLGDQYRTVEKDINEKLAAWDSLKLKKNNKA